jgi:glyceraldehyde 3-phosphate dehydrogenase
MRIGINGFGRIGRQVFRKAFESKDVEIAHVNDLFEAEIAAHLVEFDSTYGRFPHEIHGEGDVLDVDGTQISFSQHADPSDIPWGKKNVDVVLEATGAFRTRDQAAKHCKAGADKVLISAPGKDELDGDFVIGVNADQFDPEKHHIISIGSCTTNCLAPVVKVLNEEFGVEYALMNTVHAYTASQQLLDSAQDRKRLRRSRAAADNLIPTTTGAAKAIGLILPELDGRVDGMAVRAPIKCGSLLDLTCTLGTDTDADAINDAMRKWAKEPMKGVLHVEEKPIVSSDIIGSTYSSIFNPRDTKVQGKRLAKVLSWYDNEWGFSSRCLDMMKRMAS